MFAPMRGATVITATDAEHLVVGHHAHAVVQVLNYVANTTFRGLARARLATDQKRQFQPLPVAVHVSEPAFPEANSVGSANRAICSRGLRCWV